LPLKFTVPLIELASIWRCSTLLQRYISAARPGLEQVTDLTGINPNARMFPDVVSSMIEPSEDSTIRFPW
jgi:hypothetical protein